MGTRVTIRLTVDEKPCWHQVDVATIKLPLLQRLKAGEAIEVTDLGTILKSGWGEPPVDAYETIRV